MGQAIAYRVGIRPTIDYRPATRPRLTQHQLLAAVNRTVGYAVAGYISAWWRSSRNTRSRRAESRTGDWRGHGDRRRLHALRRMDCGSCARKRMGVFGVGLILIGFALQSVQYWLALLDVSIR